MKKYYLVLLSLALAVTLAGISMAAADETRDAVPARRPAARTQTVPAIQPTTQSQALPTTSADSLAADMESLLNGEKVPQAAPTAGEEINWSVIGGGGQTGTSTNWIVAGTVGQTASGSATSTNYIGLHGFWQDFGLSGPSCCVGIVGDANGDGETEPSLGDIALIIDAKFISFSCAALPCLAEADANQSGGAAPTCGDISIGDIALLIDYLFITGPSVGIPACM